MVRLSDGIECAYGENAWQTAARFVASPSDDPLALGRFELLEGSMPSYNNLAELDRQLQTITHVAAAMDLAGVSGHHIAIGTKHGNACGAAIAPTPTSALERMLTGDARAIFGGLVIVDFVIDQEAAEVLLHHETATRRLLDAVTAPSFTDDAVELLARKQGKCRLLANSALGALDRDSLDSVVRRRQVRGGYLEQPNYTFVLDLADPDIDANAELSDSQALDLLLAWAVGSTSNSNTITLVRDGQLLGNGVGQQDRVGGCALAIQRATDAGHDLACCVAYSDSYFPFPDGPQLLIDAGISAIFCTTGSVRDDEVRQTFLDAGVAYLQLADQAARGFFGH